MISLKTLEFLNDLKHNNNREWFDANKPRYEAAREDFCLFVSALIKIIGELDESVANLKPKDCVYRIYRDVRFSKDKTPYKKHFSAYFAPDAKQYKRAGYYFHLEPGNTILGGGMWEPRPEELRAVRQEIDYNLYEFKEILNKPSFKKYFSELGGNRLQRPPKDYDNNNLAIEYLRHKDFVVITKINDSILTTSKLQPFCKKAFGELHSFNSFLDRIFD